MRRLLSLISTYVYPLVFFYSISIHTHTVIPLITPTRRTRRTPGTPVPFSKELPFRLELNKHTAHFMSNSHPESTDNISAVVGQRAAREKGRNGRLAFYEERKPSLGIVLKHFCLECVLYRASGKASG